MTWRRGALAVVMLSALLVPAPQASAQVLGAVSCTPFVPPSIGPGQSIEKTCHAVNDRSLVDLTVWTFVEQDSITVYDEQDRVVDTSDPRWATFVGFFRLSVSSQRILTAGDPDDGGEAADHDVAPLPRSARAFRDVCTDRRFTELTGGDEPEDLDADACRIGRVRGFGSPYPVRGYVVTLTMRSEGNQSAYAGWGIGWNEIQRFRSPAELDCGHWTCDPVAPGLYER